MIEAKPAGYSSALSAGSKPLEIARVLCLLFMSYVHLHFFDNGQTTAPGFEISKAVLSDILGRSSVPLLSVASGFLMVGFFAKRGYKPAVSQRFRTLIFAMVFWNIIAIVVFQSYVGKSLWGVANDIFALTREPAQLHLAFLRDLMVMTALTPLIYYGARKHPLVMAILISVIYLLNLKIWIVLRVQILFFFAVGVYAAAYADRLRFPNAREKYAVYALAFLVTALQVAALYIPALSHLLVNDGGAQSIVPQIFDNAVRRPVIAFAMWCFCFDIANTVMGTRLHRFGKNMFLFFLTHALIFYGVGVVYARLPDLFHGDLIYNLVWLATPSLVIIGLNIALLVRGRILPPVKD